MPSRYMLYSHILAGYVLQVVYCSLQSAKRSLRSTYKSYPHRQCHFLEKRGCPMFSFLWQIKSNSIQKSCICFFAEKNKMYKMALGVCVCKILVPATISKPVTRFILNFPIYRVLKNYVYNVSGMIEEVKTNMFFIWQNFDLCTVLPLDGLTGRWLDFRHNTHRLLLFVVLCQQQVERVITVSTKICYVKYSKYVCVYYPFSCHSIPAMLKRVYVCTTWRFPFYGLHYTQLIYHRWLNTL